MFYRYFPVRYYYPMNYFNRLYVNDYFNYVNQRITNTGIMEDVEQNVIINNV